MGVSIREAECQLDADLFLDEYPRWDIEGPYHPVIQHSNFLHATGEVWKEAERFIHPGHWQSLPRLDPEESLSAIWMVGYWTSWKEVWDLYHEVYLLRRSPGLPPCRPWLREEAIQNILSLLISQLWRWAVSHCRKKINMVQLLLPTSHSAKHKVSPGLMRGEDDMIRPSWRPGKPTSRY